MITLLIFDITEFSHKVVGKYRNNEIKPMLFLSVIYDVAMGYNESWLLIEVNDIGDQVASILQYDLEYENILMCAMREGMDKLLDLDLVEKNLNLE